MTTQNNTISCLSISTPDDSNAQTSWAINPVTLSPKAASSIPTDTKAAARLTLNNVNYSLFYSPSAQSVTVCEETADTILAATGTAPVKEALDTMDVFYLGNQAYLATYSTSGSYLNMYRINDDFTLTSIHNQYVGSGFTMMHILPYRDTSCAVLYNGTTGDCVKYQISVPPYDGLSLTQVWSDSWAKTWGHFTFFRFGGENFFLKINQQHEKINIDHFMDDPDEGSHPVLSKNACNTLLNASVITGFQGDQGQAYFVVCQNNGSISLNSIYPNCLGWWALTSGQTETDVQVLHPLTINEKTYLIAIS